MDLISVQQNIWKEKNQGKGEDFYKNVELFSQKFLIPEYFAKYLLDNNFNDETMFINFLNPSVYFLHPPFLFKEMNKAITLINKAKKSQFPVFIYGDSDVDGVVGIKILHLALQKYGIQKILYSIPEDDEPYGISIKKIDYAYIKGARLIITVDNGISSCKEVEYAKSKGIDVIITDHHNPQKELPTADAIINPKLDNYPYCKGLSGSGVAWKLIEALIFSQTKIYEQYIYFFSVDITSFENKKDKNRVFFNITFLEISNLQIQRTLSFSYQIEDEKLINELNQSTLGKSLTFYLGKIFDKKDATNFFKQVFSENKEKQGIIVSDNIENLMKLSNSLGIAIPFENIKTIASLVNKDENFLFLLDSYRIFYINKIDFLYFKLFSTIRYNYQKCIDELEIYLPYVTLATIADIMPLLNENRYIVAKGLAIINNSKPDFVDKILSSLINVNFPINSYDIIWKISPLLNSPGRFGKGKILLNFFLSEKDEDSLLYLKEINDYNIKRTMVVENIYQTIKLSNNDKPIIYIEKEDVEPGLAGLICAKYLGLTSKPVIFVTKTKSGIFGSMRSRNSFNSFQFLNQFSEYFENFGGHPFAAGFTVINDKYNEFYNKIHSCISDLNYETEKSNIQEYNAEITFDELSNPEFEKWYKTLQPFGEEFKVPIFFTREIALSNPIFIGRNNLSTKLKVSQDNISFDALIFKSKNFINEIKLNSINSIVYEPYFMQNNKLTLLIIDLFTS